MRILLKIIRGIADEFMRNELTAMSGAFINVRMKKLHILQVI